ncbi:MAG TPA: undecaprenyl-diphosphate phosphatase [Thermoclostridium caenicola]|uniref:Undecaprenyl-diphosphatase n=1 Tax=Thermoclostridium caenicola TaxID=659425 RepID=A0A1M6BT77_9FIRM|nr:undecaprenyl-diphosphate phosphatase [Thermoclostridium caenicola]SHI51881.1 Undecaprenyl-diphosphatase [Thermoclostridium caenicola]HOK43209.1 undecaprenyl-diphosphate phosphatase [Thermoclostridium caenicola]HOL84224.1 undecaprenyl-diphosphate phosphatase [Thermoclostridium caenicola]HOP71800.1 undecaprenyl-diphosphate phosphatase [Thermoclostridium caenicola]HPO75783.1 undecaprenyl-diphosphate phosphatase [Thermoclostridium caenicola]
MNIFEAIVLGIVQGLTEFLPVSSSGHLVLFQQLFGIEGEMVVTFDVALHVGTLLAVFVVYWKRILEMIRHPFSKLPVFLVLGTIPTVIIALLFKDAIEGYYASGSLLGPGFVFTGLILIGAEKIGNGRKDLENMKLVDSLLIGAGQGLALMPGVSRSGMTITTGLALGLDRGFAADYAFLLSIPAILGGALLDVLDVVRGDTTAVASIGILPLVVGVAVAAVTGFLAIKVMLAAVKKMKLKYFAWYVMALGILIIIAQLFFKEQFPWLG